MNNKTVVIDKFIIEKIETSIKSISKQVFNKLILSVNGDEIFKYKECMTTNEMKYLISQNNELLTTRTPKAIMFYDLENFKPNEYNLDTNNILGEIRHFHNTNPFFNVPIYIDKNGICIYSEMKTFDINFSINIMMKNKEDQLSMFNSLRYSKNFISPTNTLTLTDIVGEYFIPNTIIKLLSNHYGENLGDKLYKGSNNSINKFDFGISQKEDVYVYQKKINMIRVSAVDDLTLEQNSTRDNPLSNYRINIAGKISFPFPINYTLAIKEFLYRLNVPEFIETTHDDDKLYLDVYKFYDKTKKKEEIEKIILNKKDNETLATNINKKYSDYKHTKPILNKNESFLLKNYNTREEDLIVSKMIDSGMTVSEMIDKIQKNSTSSLLKEYNINIPYKKKEDKLNLEGLDLNPLKQGDIYVFALRDIKFDKKDEIFNLLSLINSSEMYINNTNKTYFYYMVELMKKMQYNKISEIIDVVINIGKVILDKDSYNISNNYDIAIKNLDIEPIYSLIISLNKKNLEKNIINNNLI